MPLVSQDKINQILEQVDIVDIISEVVHLTKVGRDYKGLCPFHAEKTPSFYVNQEKQLFHCFGCGMGGNIFTFMKEIKGLSFSESLMSLAQRYGIPLSYKNNNTGKVVNNKDREYILSINQIAAQYFKNNLQKCEGAIKYIKNRGISEETIRFFQIGYSNPSWNGLYNYLKKNFSTTKILNAGLILEKKGGGSYYDRFRERIIFPINNIYNEIIAFGGRTISAEQNIPKYLNSPETLLYIKGQNLYGLYHSCKAIRKYGFAILVEGYLDFLSIFQAGSTNVVATLGTALTEAQVRLLKRYTNIVYLIFDSDIAGQKATKKGIELLLDAGMKIKIVILPQGDDPNSLIQKRGHEYFLKLLKNAKNFLDFLLSDFTKESTKEERIQLTRETIPTLAKIIDPIEQDAYIRHLSQYSSISEDSILDAINRIRKKTATEKLPYEKIPELNFNHSLEYKAQEMVLRIALKQKLPCAQILKHLKVSDFSYPLFSSLARIIFQIWEKGVELENDTLLFFAENDEVRELIATFLMIDNEELADEKKIIADCIKILKKQKIIKNMRIIKEKIRAVDLDDEQMNKLLLEYHKLKTQSCIA